MEMVGTADLESVPACCPPAVGAAGKCFGAERSCHVQCRALQVLPCRICAALVLQVYWSQGRFGEG